MKVYITPECKAQIMFYVNNTEIEISGLGRIQRDSLGNMVVTKVYLLDQENSSATTDLSEDAVSKCLFETRQDAGDLNFWWHSHVNMGVFWSGTDMATIKQFGSKGYLLSTVFNKKGEHRTSYYQGDNGFTPSLFIDDIQTCFDQLPTTAQAEAWLAEIKEKAKKKVFTPPAMGIGMRGKSYIDHDYDDDYSYGMPVKTDPPFFWSTARGELVAARSLSTMSELKALGKDIVAAGAKGTAWSYNLDNEHRNRLYDIHQLIFGYYGSEKDIDDMLNHCIEDLKSLDEVIDETIKVYAKEHLNHEASKNLSGTNTRRTKLIAGNVSRGNPTNLRSTKRGRPRKTTGQRV